MSIDSEGYCNLTGFKCNEPKGGYMNDSLIYNLNFYNYLNKKVVNNIAERQDFINLNSTKMTLQLFETNFKCVKARYDDDCGFVASSQEELMVHERTCLSITTTRPLVEGEFLQCEYCNKKFYDRGQKKKPKYALNAHKKNCKQNLDRNRKLYIKKFLLEASSEDIKDMFDLIQNRQN